MLSYTNLQKKLAFLNIHVDKISNNVLLLHEIKNFMVK